MNKQTDLAWKEWGRSDPYFGVLSDDKYRRSNIGTAKVDFFESGQRHITNVIADIEKHFGPVTKTSALDFGCGVGRLLVPLAKEFKQVAGLDVSEPMLEEACRNLSERSIGNVELLKSDDALSILEGREFDVIHTYIVLQHISPKRGYAIIRRLLRHLSNGGAVFLHVSCRRNMPFARELAYRCKTSIPFAYVLFNVLKGRRLFEPCMEMNEYSVGKVLSILREVGFNRVMMAFENHGDCLTASFYSKRDVACP